MKVVSANDDSDVATWYEEVVDVDNVESLSSLLSSLLLCEFSLETPELNE